MIGLAVPVLLLLIISSAVLIHMNEGNKVKPTPKDVFLNLGIIVALYTSVVAIINVLFITINVAFPQIDQHYRSLTISFPIASLIVAFPIFIFLSRLVYKDLKLNPKNKNIWVRRWLLFLTLFIAGIAFAGDLITLLWYFLDGKEVTAGFILKVLSVFVISFAIFGYFLEEIKEKMTQKKRKIWLIVSIAFVMVVIILGFSVLGSPWKQKMIRYDSMKLDNLRQIQSGILSYYQLKGRLPQSIEELRDPMSGFILPSDPQTNEPYTYQFIENLSFKLCADFNLNSSEVKISYISPEFPKYYNSYDENWEYDSGEYCFERTIDPERHPFKPLLQ